MTTTAGRELTRLHYRQQLALKAQVIRDAAALWRMFSPEDRDSWRRMVTLAVIAAQARHRASSGLAARYFESLSLAETGAREPAVFVDNLPEPQIVASLTATGLVGTIRALSVGHSPQSALANGFVRFSGSFSRLALNGGRETILASTRTSQRATRYQRVTSGNPCTFCSDLADIRSSPEAFAAHDHCSCTAEPVFG